MILVAISQHFKSPIQHGDWFFSRNYYHVKLILFASFNCVDISQALRLFYQELSNFRVRLLLNEGWSFLVDHWEYEILQLNTVKIIFFRTFPLVFVEAITGIWRRVCFDLWKAFGRGGGSGELVEVRHPYFLVITIAKPPNDSNLEANPRSIFKSFPNNFLLSVQFFF